MSTYSRISMYIQVYQLKSLYIHLSLCPGLPMDAQRAKSVENSLPEAFRKACDAPSLQRLKCTPPSRLVGEFRAWHHILAKTMTGRGGGWRGGEVFLLLLPELHIVVPKLVCFTCFLESFGIIFRPEASRAY